MPHRTVLAAVLLSGLAFSAAGQSAERFHEDVLLSFENGNDAGVSALLEELRHRDPESFRRNGYAYLAGRSAERAGDAGAAAASYLVASEPGSPLRAYALWRLSRLLRKTGGLPAERLFLIEALSVEGGSAARAAAAARIPRSWYESGDHPMVPGFAGAGTSESESEMSREDILLLARSAFYLGKRAEARTGFEQVLGSTPDEDRPDDLSLAAVEGLDLLDVGLEGFGKVAGELEAADHFRRAFVYQFNRRFRAARIHYSSIIERFPKSDLAPESAYQNGRGFAQERDFHNAVEWFERVLFSSPGTPQTEAALYQEAGAYANLNRTRESSARYERFIDEHSRSERVPFAYLNLIDLYRDSGEPGEALKWAERMLAAFPEGEHAAAAQFARARIHMSQNDWQNALRDLARLKETGFGTGTRGEAGFLTGLMLEKLNRPRDAARAYLGVSDDLKSYYGWRASERLSELNRTGAAGEQFSPLWDEALKPGAELAASRSAAQSALRLAKSGEERRKLWEVLKEAYAAEGFDIPDAPQFALPARRKAAAADRGERSRAPDPFEELLFLGLYDEAAIEYELQLGERREENSGQTIVLAELYRKGGLPARSVAFYESRWKEMPGGFPLEMVPTEDLYSMYPAPFKRELLEYCPETKVDPRFALSIMRQESRFDPLVKSVAAARGLMQFIPSTALETAQSLGISGLGRDDLYDPATSVRLGCAYLSKLFRDFPSQPEAVAASYNAGEDRMLKWYRRSHSEEPARYVPEIRFNQTRDYVSKVLSNYRIYLLLYDERLGRTRAAGSGG